MVDNVIHFVLARPEGAGPGTKGLSLFVVPKFQVDLETGELGARNDAHVTNVEHKMGLKVSTTCEVTFGEHEPAVGTLLGDVHDGIAQMFRVIEHARMLVGTKAIATLSSGYLNALEHAKSRVQGADLTQMSDKAAPRVTITHHPDVRRSLMLQKAYAEGLRALVHFAASQQDVVDAEQLRPGTEQLERGSAADTARRVNDLLLPIVKGLGSERAWVLLGTESLQTFGGSGFLQDYPIEQYVRDSKIDTLYEGTTAIQGGDVRGLYKVGQNTSRLLLAAGDLMVGWLLLRQGAVAQEALDSGASGKDVDFYIGKVAAAKFYARQILPRLAAERAIAEAADNDLMDVPESAF